jgi:predicted AlkP superfamily phosphohydrolase/phosphomutase
LGSLSEYQEFLGNLSEGIARKEAFARTLQDGDRWDLFLLVFSEAHCAGHRLWHLHDPGHPDHDPEMRQKMGDPLLQVYRRLDAATGAIVSAAGDATVVLFSPHGMGPNYGASHLLPEVLERLGLGTDKGSTANGGGSIGAAVLRDRLIGAVPDWSVRALRGVLPGRLWDALTTRALSFGNTWAGSSAFCVPGDFAGAIRINLLGREPSGKVRPGRDYDALCEDLKEALMELKEVASGRPAVKDVVRIDKVFAGEALDQLPDLMVCWMDDQPIKGLTSPRIGDVRGVLQEARSGEDRSDGFLVISGCSSLDDDTTRATADLMDLAPTITELMGLPANVCFDGRSLLVGLDAEGGTDEGSAR